VEISPYYRNDFIKQYTIVRAHATMGRAIGCEIHVTATVEGNREFRLHMTNVIDGFATEHTYPISPIKRCRSARGTIGQHLRPDADHQSGTQGTVVGEDYYYWTTDVHDDPKLRRFLPHDLLDSRVAKREWHAKMRT